MSNRCVPDWLTQWEYAHRGLHGEGVPENSLEGARLAIEAGLGIECDIQRSSDDFPMVFHDWEVDRLTEESGKTEHFRADELECMKLNGTDQTPIRFGRFLDFVNGQVPLLIEIKSRPGYDVEWTNLYVHNYLKGYAGPYAVMSFDPRVARWFRRNSPDTLCGLVMREDAYGDTQTPEERQAAFDDARPDFLAYHIAALPSAWVASLHEGGLPVLTWTVNTPETRDRALQNADALIVEAEGFA